MSMSKIETVKKGFCSRKIEITIKLNALVNACAGGQISCVMSFNGEVITKQFNATTQGWDDLNTMINDYKKQQSDIVSAEYENHCIFKAVAESHGFRQD